MRSSLFPFFFLVLATCGDTAHLPLSGRRRSIPPGLQRRASLSGTLSPLSDSQDVTYTTNVTLNGKAFSVMIDTGSSDLWVSTSVPGAVPQHYQADVEYAGGSASGNVMSATLDFAGYSIDSQYFIYAPNGDAAAGADGLIGLGPSSGSTVRILGNSSVANPPLDRIFTSNSSLSPILGVLLQRSDDPDERYPGDLSVGEVLPDYQDVLNQPRLPVTLVPLEGGQHWQTLLDANGIIGPNGKPIEIKSQVKGAQTQNATVVFDTGFSLPQVPSYVAEALYGGIPSASIQNVTGAGEVWTLPCDAEVNATFLFAGIQFPIHPLDLNFDGFDLDNNMCIGAFQPLSYDSSQQGEILYDMVLGMAFLRNAYMLVNFGDMLNDATPSTNTAYIQLLPITNATEAAQDFARVRNGSGNGLSRSGSPLSRTKSWLWLIGLVVGIIVALVLLIACVACCCCRRRAKKTPLPSAPWVGNTPSYRPIHDPSPQAAYDMHMAPGAPAGYAPQQVPGYHTAWDARR